MVSCRVSCESEMEPQLSENLAVRLYPPRPPPTPGDFNAVRLGAHVCVGDKSVITTVDLVHTGFAASTDIGSWVIIEPGASLTSCMIGDR